MFLQIGTMISQDVTLPAINSGIVRVRFQSSTSVHSSTRFVLHYSTQKPWQEIGACPGLTFNGAPSSTDWHHVAATVEQVNSSSLSLSIYVDGVLSAHDGISTPWPVLSLAGVAGVAIGRGDPSRAPPLLAPFAPSDGGYGNALDQHQGAETFWAGGLDELRVWDYARSPEEIVRAILQNCTYLAATNSRPLLCFAFDEMVTNGTQRPYFQDFGTGSASDAQAVVGDKFSSWCTTIDDGGVLVDEVKLCLCHKIMNLEFSSFCIDSAPVMITELKNIDRSRFPGTTISENRGDCARISLDFRGSDLNTTSRA